jgi:rSAM/selenodomain-associated transferase 1
MTALTRREPSNGLILFARYPRLGKVKTRLEPSLGAQRCLVLYEAMLADCVERCSLVDCSLNLYLHGCDLAEAQELATRIQEPAAPELRFRLQEGADLGERMWKAYTEASRCSSKVVIVGSDSPSVPLRFIRSAFDRLEDRPIVIGPVDDGGYYLIGLSGPRKEAFQGIRWGTSSVLSQTTVKLARSDYELLPEWYDIDNSEDLDHLVRDLSQNFEGYPARTAEYLREAGLLSSNASYSESDGADQC